MVEWTWQKIGGLILGVITLIVIVSGTFFNMFPEVKTVARDIIGTADELIGIEEISTMPTVAISDEHRAAILQLKETIEDMLADNNLECVANYGGLPPLGEIGDSGASIEMQYNIDKTDFTIRTTGGQLLTDLSFSIDGMQPCVIAGEYNGHGIPDSFYRLISGQNAFVGTIYDKQVNNIQIGWARSGAGLVSCHGGNKITVPELGEDIVNDQCNNLDDGGWIFKPVHVAGTSICFFPTVYGNNLCDGDDKDGLDNDCLTDIDEGISKAISEHRLVRCPLPSPELIISREECNSGNEESCFLMAEMYLLEDGFEQRGLNSLRDFCLEGTLVTNSNQALSCRRLGDYYNQNNDLSQAGLFYSSACDLNDWESCTQAGNMLNKVDDHNAISFFERGCNGASDSQEFSASSCYNLAGKYIRGEFVEVNIDRAVELLNRAWQEGSHSLSCYKLRELGEEVVCNGT